MESRINRSNGKYIDIERARRIARLVDIVKVAREFTQLSGTNDVFVGKCPMHRERIPSFTVSRRHQSFNCFKCGLDGSALTLVLWSKHIRYGGAVEYLETNFLRFESSRAMHRSADLLWKWRRDFHESRLHIRGHHRSD